jgi:hypothetical protein
MEEKELIGKLRKLRQIKPNRDWVILTKSQILGKERKLSLSYYLNYFLRIGYGGLVVVFFLFGLFALSQKSLPGEFLYPLKKISERAQVVFLSEKEKPKVSLELANKRLEELAKVAKNNQVKNLAPAINEFQASISEATKNLSKIKANNSEPMVVKRFVDQAKKIEEKVKEVKSLGVVIKEKELNKLEEVSNKLELELLVSVLKNMISDLENRTLTEKQEEILLKMKELMEKEKYSEALELYLVNQ